MSRTMNSVVTGIVIDLDDPESLGRVKLRFPWMSESEPESNWARIATVMSGGERGFQFMPEIDDEVLVAFEQGDLRFPYVLGYLWNGQNKPPQTDPKKRTLKTVSGHTLEFDDSDGSEKISLLFKGDLPSITMTATEIRIELDGGTFITLDSAGVTIKGTQIKLN